MILFFKAITKLFSRKKGAIADQTGYSNAKAGLVGEPITCLGCKKTFAVKKFPGTNGVCPKCQGDEFSFKTDEVPDDELAANKELSEGAKFVLDADDQHVDRMNGRKLITFLKNQGLLG
ncbi:MAG: hypothetical protein AB7K09_19595 [Planctomycetota bacterium]